uniref:Uncharacterized protein n=1 Tax=Nelumbo nucifera TaxID=4432 RepID=A0A822XRX3_NELNU|nr:TPA_asm: hypothetical protein HUJ06_024530 [Nelumbo nucifera]
MAPRLLACFQRRSVSSSTTSTAENATADQASEEQRRGGAILVELFSSQGCATSPEAELLISRLGRGDFELEVPVIILAYHVDYWDYMGWKDPFGSSQCTVRQKAYAEALKLDTMFTPQVVVQGRTQCVGTDQEALLSNITSAVRFASPSFQVRVLRIRSHLFLFLFLFVLDFSFTTTICMQSKSLMQPWISPKTDKNCT